MSAASPPNLRQRLLDLSLHKKILLPFFIILVLLGCVVIVGARVQIRQALFQTADQRLLAIHEGVYREIKKQELLLLTYANIVEFQQHVTDSHYPTARVAIAQDSLLTRLSDANITVTVYPFDDAGSIGIPTYDTLFRQSAQSHKPRFRFVVDTGTTPSLVVAAPLQSLDQKLKILLLQTPLDAAFLKKIVAPFKVDASLLSLDNALLVSTREQLKFPALSNEEILAITSGKPALRTVVADETHRQLISAIPLGDSDMILLASDLSMSDLDLLLRSMATRSGLTILTALLFGSYLYYRLILHLIGPLKDILQATSQVGEGNLHYRIDAPINGELGQLADSFNHMMEQLDSLYRQQVNQEKDLALANEQVRFTEILEKKNQEIERTNRELKTHLREISVLFQLNQVMSSTLDLNIMFDRTLALLRDILNCSEMVLLLYNQGTEELIIKKTIGHDIEMYAGVTFTITEGITGLAARSRELLYVRDVAKDERYLNYKGKVRAKGSMISAPIVVKNRLVGVLNLHKPQVDAFTDTDLKLTQAATNQLGVAIENAQLYEKTRTLSNTDDLTGLANRRYFQDILRREFAHAGRYHSNFSLIMIDIDRFKQFNDTYGHLNGDVVLRRVATVLLQNTRGIDLVARFGGEEFIVLLPKTTREGALAAAEKLRECVAAEIITIPEQEPLDTSITISLGIAEYPTDAKDVYDLIDLADRALYKAKEQGRNCTVLCDSPVDAI